MNKKIFATVLIVLLSWTIKSQNNTQKEYLKMREANRASLVPKTKILNDCNFFGGDTLSGFPIETEVDALLLKYKNCDYNELKTTIKNKEVTFIKNKYKIEKLPFELAEEKYNKTHQIQYNNPNKPTNNSKGANPSPFASACGNLDFENGDFSNWIGYEGHNTNSNAALNLGGGTGPITPPPNLNSVETSCDYFAILNAGFGSDPLSGTTVPSPLGGNCARLGGENRNLGTTGPPIDCDPTPSNSSNYTAGEVLETTFTVTPANTAFQYAFVFVYADDGFHVNGAQPYFRIEVLDHLGANITCLSYYQQGNNGVAPVGYSSNGSVFYNSNWKISSLNLKPYLNQAVTIRFTVCGCTQQAHFGYAYVDCKCAPLELIIPNAVCQGQSATLTAPPQSDGTYAWTGSGAITSATTNSIITTSTAGTYTVKITNQQGCSYTLDTTIAFFPNPIVAVNSPTTCAGNAVVLNATSTGSAGALTYAWNPMTNLTAVHDSTATATVNSNTSYVVTGTSVHGCTATATSNIVTTGAPPPTFSAPPVCLGASTVINNTTAGGGTFDWDFGDASAVVTNQTSPTHIYATTGTFVVTSTVTLAGCVGTGTANVIVNPIPTATIGAPPVCVGTATTFTSTVTNGNTYTWDYGDPVGSSAAGSATPSHTYAAPNTYAVTVTVTAAAPTSCTVTATTNAIVSVVPTASFSVAPVCMGTASVFDASASTPAAGLTYAWSFGGTAPNTDVVATPTDNHTYSSANTFPVTLTVSVGSCSATTTGNAVVNPFPVLGFTANHPCDGAPMNITNNTSAPATISNWNWDFGDGASSTVNPPPAHTYSAAGCYSVVLTATASTGCSGSHDTVVYIHPNPVASFTAIEQCLGTPSDFLDGSVIQNPACLSDQITAWSYDFGDGTVTPFTSANIPISPADSIKHTYATCGPKNIIVTVTTNNACTNTSTLIGDTVFCPPVVVAPLDYTVCPGAPTPVQAFTTTCINGGNAFSVWGEFTFVTGAPASYLFNPQVSPNFDVVPSYAAIATNPLCSVIRDTVFAVPISGAGCVGNSTYYIANVWPTPTVTPVASATVCPNAMVPAVTFAGCPGVAATETFTWTATGDNVGLASPGAGNIATFAGQNALPGSVVAISTVSVTPLAHGCSGPGTTFSVTVDPIPTMTVTSPLPYCPAATIASTDYNISTTPAVGVTYTWTATNNPGTGMLAGGTGAAPSASYPAPANPSQVNQISVVTYTPSLNGCIGASVSDTITIKPTPIMVAMPDQAFCPGVMTNSVNLATLPASPASTFSWSSNAPPIGASGNSNSIPAFGPTQNPGLTTLGIAVTVTPTLNGCVGPPSGFNIYVYPSPIAKFSASKLVCEGLSMNFSDLSVPNTGTNTVNNWAWDMGNDGSVDASGKNPVPYTFPAGVTGSIPVSLTVTTVNTCTAQVIENVYVNPNPVPDFVGDNLKSCPNLLTNFTYVVTPIVPYVKTTYTWNFGNGKNLTAISNPPPAAPIPVAPGTQTYTNSSPTTAQFYTVTLTAVTDSTCKGVQTKAPYVEVYPHPIANFTWGPTDADIDNSTITFVNEAIGVSTYTPAPMTYGPNGIDYTLGDIYTPVPALNYHAGNGDPHEQFIHTYEHYDTATYNVTQWVINKYGCRDSIVKPVYIGPNFTFYIPNAFSPNGDGTNEGFKGLGVGIDNTTYNLWVFDRWGLMIFYADDIDKSWDGHMRGNDSKPVLQEDVYVWKVKFHDFTGKLHEYHGTVTLLK